MRSFSVLHEKKHQRPHPKLWTIQTRARRFDLSLKEETITNAQNPKATAKLLHNPIKATLNAPTEAGIQIAKLPTREQCCGKVPSSENRRQHPQRTLRPHAPKLTQNEKYAKKMVKSAK